MNTRIRLSSALLGFLFTVPLSFGQEEIVFEDHFEDFELGETWKPHGVSEPDAGLNVFEAGNDGSSLRVSSTSGDAGELLGIETSPISLAGVRSLRVEVRFRPLNQTAAGDGGASDASAGLSVVGEAGAFASVSAGANRPQLPDWGDFYWDSEGSQDVESAPWLHFPPNDPDGSAESFRTHVLEISDTGTSLTTLSSGGNLLETTPFDVVNLNLKLSDFGESIRIVLFQLRSEDETTLGDVDHVTVSVVANPRPTQISSLTVERADSKATIVFDSKPNFTYAVETSAKLRVWIELTDGLKSEGETTTYVDEEVPADTTERYYRVKEESQ